MENLQFIFDTDRRPNRLRTVNSQLTRLIIRYHEEGYTEDFFINSATNRLYLLRDQHSCFPYFRMNIVSQCYDSLTKGYKYIHIIETTCGLKGLLISCDIQFKN
ncbi:hypothetical protein KXD93_22005 [Mucilaginibacter sp. BJC16-A38]|uniref:hypothetical protein n=1 Tax=Mucilaginibacter phenanthrenivorans TaxID=1234842 RepID=UPI002158913C|nr:hypothetical protein [Mucilaginibacter phenanthrenivorans]MCR8560343.1 hypothetical protein [Mucilaginibacter phenanthrenivorans]